MPTKSESIGALVAALCKAREEFAPIHKTAENPHFHSKFAPLDEILGAVTPALTKNGLAVLQMPEGEELVTILAHTSGEFISASYGLHAVKDDPQALGSAITYARRYGLAAVLGVAAESDDDAESATAHKGNGDAAKTPRPAGGDGASSGEWTVPFKKSEYYGSPASKLPQKELVSLRKYFLDKLNKEPQSQYAQGWQTGLDALNAELTAREAVPF